MFDFGLYTQVSDSGPWALLFSISVTEGLLSKVDFASQIYGRQSLHGMTYGNVRQYWNSYNSLFSFYPKWKTISSSLAVALYWAAGAL